MKIVIAPDSFKESLTAMAVASEIEAGFREFFPDAQYVKLPVADGGEGTVQAMIDASGGRRVEMQVTGPLGEPVSAFYGLMGDGATAVIEMAAASGLELVPPARRNPLHTTSYGTGQLILNALDAGARRFVLGVGGSATNDGGAGMLQALGGRLLDAAGADLNAGGGALAALARIDLSALDPRIKDSVFDIACDVTNPLVGERGASAIFGPQKGATPEMVEQLDANLRHYAAIIARDLDQHVADAGARLEGRRVDQFEGVFHILGGERRAVMPGHALAQLDLPGQAAFGDAAIGLAGNLDRQVGHQVALGIGDPERVEDLHPDRLVDLDARHQRVERGRLLRQPDDDLAGGLARRRRHGLGLGARRAEARGRKQAAGAQRKHVAAVDRRHRQGQRGCPTGMAVSVLRHRKPLL